MSAAIRKANARAGANAPATDLDKFRAGLESLKLATQRLAKSNDTFETHLVARGWLTKERK